MRCIMEDLLGLGAPSERVKAGFGIPCLGGTTGRALEWFDISSLRVTEGKALVGGGGGAPVRMGGLCCCEEFPDLKRVKYLKN